MNDGLIPNRYAKALYKLSSEQGDSQEVYLEMKNLAQNYRNVDGLKATISNPFISTADKESVLLKATGAKKGGSLNKFILLVIKNRRELFLQNMALSFVKIYREVNKISQVEIVSATKLPDDKIKQLTKIVEAQLGDRQLEVETRVDEDIIGGFVINVDSVVLDASVSNELKKLRLKLLS